MTVFRTSLRNLLWLGFFAVILIAWWLLWEMARMSGLNPLGQPIAANRMPMQTLGVLVAMWALMMAAMMLPTLVPTLSTYETLITSANGSRAGWIGVLSGYFAVWVGVAALLGVLQHLLLQGGAVDLLGIFTSGWLSAVLLIVVGAYQFTRIKDLCHGVCLSPMQYFLGSWRTGLAGGLRMGLGLGTYCAVCCWGYMALGFVAGTMSLLWMGLATLLMVLEKLPQVAGYIVRPVGAALIAGGLAMAVFTALEF